MLLLSYVDKSNFEFLALESHVILIGIFFKTLRRKTIANLAPGPSFCYKNAKTFLNCAEDEVEEFHQIFKKFQS